jgi:hypothetical protein
MNIILSFFGVWLLTLGIITYISGIVKVVVKGKTFSNLDAIYVIFLISLGMSILLNI